MNKTRIQLFILFFFMALFSCISEGKDQVFKKPWYTISTNFGFEPTSRQYKTLKNKNWLVHRDHFFNDLRVNFEIRFIQDSLLNEITVQDVEERISINVEKENEIEINGLKGKKMSGSVLLYDSQTNKNLKFHETIWILKGRHSGIFKIVFDSVNLSDYSGSLDAAEEMVNTFQETNKF